MTEYRDTMEIQLPEPYLTAIGRVCVQWATLESTFDITLRKLAGFELLDNRATIITAHMPWPMRMDIVYSLVEKFRPDYPHLARFDGLKPLLKKAQEGRNRVVHAVWAYEDGVVSTLRATARGKLKAHIDPITVAEIDSIATNIGTAAAQVLKAVLNK